MTRKLRAGFSPQAIKCWVVLPIPGSSLQARFSGPYSVQKKVSERDYLIATPDRNRRSRLRHVNMLKPYHEHEPASNPVAVTSAMPSVGLSSAHLGKSVSACVAALSSGESVRPALTAVARTTVGGEEDFVVPSKAVVQERLQNSEMLTKLDSHLVHLPNAQRADIVELILSHKLLFSDVTSCTTVLKHDIDVGDSSPIKQHAYRVNPDKRCRCKRS